MKLFKERKCYFRNSSALEWARYALPPPTSGNNLVKEPKCRIAKHARMRRKELKTENNLHLSLWQIKKHGGNASNLFTFNFARKIIDTHGTE